MGDLHLVLSSTPGKKQGVPGRHLKDIIAVRLTNYNSLSLLLLRQKPQLVPIGFLILLNFKNGVGAEAPATNKCG